MVASPLYSPKFPYRIHRFQLNGPPEIGHGSPLIILIAFKLVRVPVVVFPVSRLYTTSIRLDHSVPESENPGGDPRDSFVPADLQVAP